jgi:Domain of unknown function (DUF4384)
MRLRWRVAGLRYALVVGAWAVAGSPIAAQTPSRKPARPAEPSAAAAYDVLDRHCASCHQHGAAGRSDGLAGLGNVLELSGLARDPVFVRPGNPDGSRLYTLMLRRSMPPAPPDRSDVRPSADDLRALRTWIAALPPAPACEVVRPSGLTPEAFASLLIEGSSNPLRRWVSIEHLRDPCAGDGGLTRWRNALVALFGAAVSGIDVASRTGSEETPALYELNLATLGWTAATWEDLLRRGGRGGVAGVRPSEGALRRIGTTSPIVRADWLTHVMTRSATAGAGPAAPEREPGLVEALARQYTRPVALDRAAVELGVPSTSLLKLAETHAGVAGRLARRLAQSLMARAEFEAGLPAIATALEVDLAGAAAAPITSSKDWPIDPGPGLAIVTDKLTYAVGDRLRLEVRATSDCAVTLINVDRTGRGTVILPSELEPNNLLRAGEIRALPGEGAGYTLRLNEPGRETIIGLCNPAPGTVDGIRHDFEKQRFTDLGDYSAFLHKALVGDARPPASDRVLEPPKPREARKRPRRRGAPPDVPPAARSELVVRTAISVEVR